jgi:hypothetical protein
MQQTLGLAGYGTSIRCLLGIACRCPESRQTVVLLADCWQGVDHEVVLLAQDYSFVVGGQEDGSVVCG